MSDPARDGPARRGGAAPLRVLGETALLALVAWLLLLGWDYETPQFYLNFFTQGTPFVVLAAAGYAALRLRGRVR